MKTSISLITVTLMLASCASDDDQQPSQDHNLKNELRWNDLRVGQSNRFIVFRTSCPTSGNIEYTGDTLLLEVVSQGEGLGLRESYTDGSPILQLIDIIPAIYPVIPENDYLLLPERNSSRLFFFFGNDTLPMQKPSNINLQQGSCFIEYSNGEPFIGEEIGRISPYSIGDKQYFDKRVVSCVPPFLNLDAYLVFDSKQLHISMSISADPGAIFNVSGFGLIAND